MAYWKKSGIMQPLYDYLNNQNQGSSTYRDMREIYNDIYQNGGKNLVDMAVSQVDIPRLNDNLGSPCRRLVDTLFAIHHAAKDKTSYTCHLLADVGIFAFCIYPPGRTTSTTYGFQLIELEHAIAHLLFEEWEQVQLTVPEAVREEVIYAMYQAAMECLDARLKNL
jgi:hypothetical protein